MADNKTIKIGATPSGMLPPPPLVSTAPKQKLIPVQKTVPSENYMDNIRTLMEAKQDEEQNRNILKTSAVDKVFAGAYAFSQGSTTAAAINKNLLLKQSENSKNIDKDFKSGLTTTFIQEYMNANQIPNNEKYFELINGASNGKHLNEIKDYINNDMYMTNTVNNSIGAFAKGASMFVGELATHPLSAVAALPVIIPKTLLLAKGTYSTMATIGSSVGMSYLANEMTAYGDPSMTLDQKILGLGIGALADLTATRMMVNKYRKADEYMANTQKAIDDLIVASEANAKTKSNFTNNKYDMSTNYKWSSTKESMAANEINIAKQVEGELQPLRQRTIEEEISSFKPTKQEPDEVRQAKSGLSPEDFAIRQSKAVQAVQDVKALIKSASVGVEKVQLQELEQLIPAIKEIGKFYPDGEAQLMKEVARVTGKAIGQTGAKATKEAVGKTKTGLAFKLGKKKETFDERSARFDKEIARQEAKQKLDFGKKTKEDLKAGKKTLEDVKVKPEVLSELSKVQKALLKAETTREALSTITGNEAKVAKLESDIATMSEKEAMLLAESEGYAVSATKGFASSLAKQKEIYQRMASATDEIINELEDTLAMRIADDLPTKADKEEFGEALSKDLTEAFSTKIKVTVNEGLVVDGSVDMAVKGDNVLVNGKLVPIALVVATSSTVAMADDGTTITASGVGLIVLAVILGISPIQAYRKNQSIMREAKNSANEIEAVHEVAKIESDPIVKERKSLADKAYDFTKTGYISSYFTVEKYGTSKAVELLNQLVENPSMYSGIPADVIKSVELKTALGRINKAEHDNFNEWVNEMSLDRDHLDSIMNLGSENNLLREYRELVSDAIDNPNAEYPKAVKAQAVASRVEFDKVLEDMITNGIAGAEEARKIKNYFPHYTKSGSLALIGSTEEGKALLVNAVAVMIKEGSGRTMEKSVSVAKEWIKVHTKISTGVNISTKDADRFMNAMDSLGIDMKGISKEEIMMASSMSKDVMSRVKSRIPMKMSAFVPFKANVDGTMINISLSDLFMRNSNEVIKKYMNESYGQIALKKAIGESYTSEHALRAIINSDAIGTNREVRDVLNMYVSAIAGKPLYDAGTVFNRNIDIAKNLSYGKLLFATASMTPEFLKATWAIFKNHETFAQGVKELRNIWKDIPANTALSEELSYMVMGTGTSAVIKEGSFKGIDSFTNVNEDIGGFAGRIANANKSTSLWLSRLIHADDAMKRLSSIHNLHRLKDIANGTATMSVQRMKRYGIDSELIDIVNRRLILDDKKNIMSLGFDKWTIPEQNKFRAVMHQMNQQRSLEVMIGGIPKAFMDNPAGRLLSFLGSFSAQLYSTHFVGMFKSLDQEEMANQITWLLGGMITTLAKDAAFGSDKEISDEELFTRTLMASPAVGLYSAIHLFANPIVPSMAADAMDEMTRTAKIVSKE